MYASTANLSYVLIPSIYFVQMTLFNFHTQDESALKDAGHREGDEEAKEDEHDVVDGEGADEAGNRLDHARHQHRRAPAESETFSCVSLGPAQAVANLAQINIHLGKMELKILINDQIAVACIRLFLVPRVLSVLIRCPSENYAAHEHSAHITSLDGGEKGEPLAHQLPLKQVGYYYL